MPFKPVIIFSLLLSATCTNPDTTVANKNENVKNKTPNTNPDNPDNPYGTIREIPLPENFERTKDKDDSFSEWLRNLPLKKQKTVYLFNGKAKANQQAQFAVMDISVGDKDLQQCADAVMRLRGEYLFAQKRFNEIVFTDNENGIYKFSHPYSKENFAKFMQKVFGMCGSASLSKQLNRVDNFTDVQPGDVIIRGGFPGHAVIVLDVAINKSGEKIFLLAQSFMPAQDIHVLVNPTEGYDDPWFTTKAINFIITPEYTFTTNELKRW